MSSEKIYVGNQVRVSWNFTRVVDDADVDPSVVRFEFMDPSRNVTRYLYLTDTQLVKDSTGHYHVDVNADESGTFQWKAYSTGSGQAAIEGSFEVEVSNF